MGIPPTGMHPSIPPAKNFRKGPGSPAPSTGRRLVCFYVVRPSVKRRQSGLFQEGWHIRQGTDHRKKQKTKRGRWANGFSLGTIGFLERFPSRKGILFTVRWPHEKAPHPVAADTLQTLHGSSGRWRPASRDRSSSRAQYRHGFPKATILPY